MSDGLRVLTFNLLAHGSAGGAARHDVVREALPALAPHVVALQEVTRDGAFDQAGEILGSDFTVVDLPGADPILGGCCLATRCPVSAVHVLDRPLDAHGADHGRRATAAAVEILGPGEIGQLLVVHHSGTFELTLENVREQQAVATARFVEDVTRGRPELPVVLLGDFNAAPEAASIRFLTGRQSLDGTSVRYEDAWEALHGSALGATFEPGNPLVRQGEMPLERGRRIDYVMVRSNAHGPLLAVAECRLVLDEPVEGVWPSDHKGLLAVLERPPHAPGRWARHDDG